MNKYVCFLAISYSSNEAGFFEKSLPIVELKANVNVRKVVYRLMVVCVILFDIYIERYVGNKYIFHNVSEGEGKRRTGKKGNHNHSFFIDLV